MAGKKLPAWAYQVQMASRDLTFLSWGRTEGSGEKGRTPPGYITTGTNPEPPLHQDSDLLLLGLSSQLPQPVNSG